ncbi:MAG: phage portal protein [Candidatus Binatia bacterium]
MPWLRAVTEKIAISIAAVNWRVFVIQRDGRSVRDIPLQRADYNVRQKLLDRHRESGNLREISDHPLVHILAHANDFTTGLTVRKLTQIYLDLVGEAFWIKERNALGMPVAIWVIPPSWVHGTPTPQRRWFDIQFLGWRGQIPDTEIVWFVDPDPVNPYGRGTGKAQSLADELETDEFTAKHTKNWFYNRARPDMIISAEGIDKDDTERLEQDWLNKHQGFWRAFKPHFFNKKLDVNVLSQNFKNMELIKLREFERNTIVQIFGVPPELLGILQNSNRATIEGADFLFSRWVLVPRLEFLRTTMQERFVPEFDDRLILDYDSPVDEDKVFKLDAAKANPHSLDMDEWRRIQGLEAKPANAGKVHFVPANLIPTGINGGNGRNGGNGTLQADNLLEKKNRPLQIEQKQTLQELEELVGEDSYVAVHRIARRLEPQQRRLFIQAVREARDATDIDEIVDGLRSANVERALAAVGFQQLASRLGESEEIMRTVFNAAAEEASGVLLTNNGIQAGFDLTNPRAVEWARVNSAKLVTGVTDESRAAIRGIIERTIVEGGGPDAAARQIRDSVGMTKAQVGATEKFMSQLIADGVAPDVVERRVAAKANARIFKRSKNIARTELIAASNAGQQELWQQAVDADLITPETKRSWIVTPDDRLDKIGICEPMDGQEVGLKEPFITGLGAEVMQPPAHPLCRCAMKLSLPEP